MTKIYGIYGRREAIIRVPVGNGKAFLQIEFSKGNPQNGPYYAPATYVSADKTEQQMIESSIIFGEGKLIQLIRTFGETEETVNDEDGSSIVEQPVKAAPKKSANKIVRKVVPVQDKDNSIKEYPGVTSIEEARTLLKSLGATATVLVSEESMKSYMEQHGIAFPNFTF